MADTRLTREDLQAVKKYVLYGFCCRGAVIIIILSNCIRFVIDQNTYESIRLIIRIITYGGLAGLFLGSASGREWVNISEKLHMAENSPQGKRLKQRTTISYIIGFISIAIGLLALYMMWQGLKEGVERGMILWRGFYFSLALELIASVFLCKKALNSIDRMDI